MNNNQIILPFFKNKLLEIDRKTFVGCLHALWHIGIGSLIISYNYIIRRNDIDINSSFGNFAGIWLLIYISMLSVLCYLLFIDLKFLLASLGKQWIKVITVETQAVPFN